MQKNGLNPDFLENGSNDFANMGNLNEASPRFWKNLDLELRNDSG